MSTDTPPPTPIQTELAPENRGEPESHSLLRIWGTMARTLERLVRLTDPVHPGRVYPGLDPASRGDMVGPLPVRVTLPVPSDGTEGKIDRLFNSLTIANPLAVPVYVWHEYGDAALAAAGTIPTSRVITVAPATLLTAPVAGSRIYAAITSGGAGGEIAIYAWPTVQSAWRG
jgi:hypothetical protein